MEVTLSYEEQMAQAAAAYYGLRLDEASNLYRALVAAYPQDYEAHLGLARTLLRMRDREGTLMAARQCQALDPQRPEAYVVEGVMHFLVDDLDAAEAALETALQYAPQDPEALLTLAQVYCDRGDLSRADQTLEEARRLIEAQPEGQGRDALRALAWHAQMYRHLVAGEKDPAYEAAQRVIALESANPYAASLAYANLGILETQARNYDRAIEYLERAWSSNPHFYRAGGTLGRLLIVKGDYERAIDILQEILNHPETDTAEARYAYALALARAGRRKEAREQYHRALAKGLRGPSLWLARWQTLWLADATRYLLIGLGLIAVALWVWLGRPSAQAITLATLIVTLVVLQRIIGRRR